MASPSQGNGSSDATPLPILSATRMGQTITRMAHEIVEKNRTLDDFVIVGIVTRGAILARRLAATLKEITGHEIPSGILDNSLYRDDYHKRGPVVPEFQGTDIPFSINDKTVLLVDDVLFTGRTINASIRHLFDLGRPRRIQLAVLVDRGHRELPFRADYCGKNLPTQYVEKIRVRFTESDGVEGVWGGEES